MSTADLVIFGVMLCLAGVFIGGETRQAADAPDDETSSKLWVWVGVAMVVVVIVLVSRRI